MIVDILIADPRLQSVPDTVSEILEKKKWGVREWPHQINISTVAVDRVCGLVVSRHSTLLSRVNQSLIVT